MREERKMPYQFVIILYILVIGLFVTYLVMGIKAFHKYLNEDKKQDEENK